VGSFLQGTPQDATTPGRPEELALGIVKRCILQVDGVAPGTFGTGGWGDTEPGPNEVVRVSTLPRSFLSRS